MPTPSADLRVLVATPSPAFTAGLAGWIAPALPVRTASSVRSLLTEPSDRTTVVLVTADLLRPALRAHHATSRGVVLLADLGSEAEAFLVPRHLLGVVSVHAPRDVILDGLARAGARRRPARREPPPLSLRQAEVLERLARGEGPAGIARHLEVSVSSVRSHLRRVEEKLGLGPADDALRELAPVLVSLSAAA